jgi:hypothetical protein
MFSDLRLGDLNYLVSVYPTLKRQAWDALLVTRKQNFTIIADSWLKMTQSGLWRR